MDINHTYKRIFLLLIVSAKLLSCAKNKTCSKEGYEFIYSKPGVSYSPGFDSIALGEEVILEASAPKTFFDEEKQYTVTFNGSNISGPLVINKATNDSSIPVSGAMENVELSSLIGVLVKDSIHLSTYQLNAVRTAYWDSDLDCFRLKVSIKPKIKGIFFIGLNQQGNRDTDCALYKYFLKVRNSDQHLYFVAGIYNGYISESSRNYLYCFKVY